MKLSEAFIKSKAEIRNIIFDWGGVITNLYPQETIDAFNKIGGKRIDMLYKKGVNDVFLPFEKGEITPEEFRKHIRTFTVDNISDEEIDKAWNKMLGELPQERWRLLKKLGENYRTFVLSNTNSIHVHYYFEYLQKIYGTYGYTHLFEKVYFSFELGMRKPDEEIFRYVMKDRDLKPENTVFIDDSQLNTQSAGNLGMHTITLQHPLSITDLFI